MPIFVREEKERAQMTDRIDRFMIRLGFTETDVRNTRFRPVFYAAIGVMGMIAAAGIALNIGI